MRIQVHKSQLFHIHFYLTLFGLCALSSCGWKRPVYLAAFDADELRPVVYTLDESALNVSLIIVPTLPVPSLRDIKDAGLTFRLKATNVGSHPIQIWIVDAAKVPVPDSSQTISPGASEEVFYGPLDYFVYNISGGNGEFAFAGHGAVKLEFHFEHTSRLKAPLRIEIRTNPSNPTL
jgi:hypothetical protein